MSLKSAAVLWLLLGLASPPAARAQVDAAAVSAAPSFEIAPLGVLPTPLAALPALPAAPLVPGIDARPLGAPSRIPAPALFPAVAAPSPLPVRAAPSAAPAAASAVVDDFVAAPARSAFELPLRSFAAETRDDPGTAGASARLFDGSSASPLPIPVFNRKRLPAPVVAGAALTRRFQLASLNDPFRPRFLVPKTKAYVDAVVGRLLAGSGLQELAWNDDGLTARLEDDRWDMPAAAMNAGVLRMGLETVAVLSSEDEVAAVAAHEIAHYLLAHCERLTAAMESPWRRLLGRNGPRAAAKMRRRHEFEADALSLRLLANAGYDPTAAISALLKIDAAWETGPRVPLPGGPRGEPSGLPYHPSAEERVRAMRAVIAREGLVAAPRRSRGLPEVYAELAGRRLRSKDGEGPAAADLYPHYGEPKVFAP